MRRSILMLLALATISLAQSEIVRAEPYFAVREGLKCANCHVSPSGGGMRTAFGNAWAQTSLPAQRIEVPGVEPWTGTFGRYVLAGGDLRAGYTYSHVPNEEDRSDFDVEELRAYLGVDVIPSRLLVYVDQRLAPGGSTNLETYARYTSADQRWYGRVGQFYLPYGWRLEDDTTFVRQVTGINYATPDRGIEFGLETAQWSAQLSVTNGTAAGAEVDRGKQASLRAEHVRSAWRAGVSYNYNDAKAGNRSLQGIFAGLRTGPIAWLGEADYIIDDSFPDGRRKQWTGLLEGNWMFLRGHNLKIGAEYFDPDTDVDEDQQTRYSAVWEYTPFQFVQLRTGARFYEGIPQNDAQNRRIYFVSVHGFF